MWLVAVYRTGGGRGAGTSVKARRRLPGRWRARAGTSFKAFVDRVGGTGIVVDGNTREVTMLRSVRGSRAVRSAWVGGRTTDLGRSLVMERSRSLFMVTRGRTIGRRSTAELVQGPSRVRADRNVRSFRRTVADRARRRYLLPGDVRDHLLLRFAEGRDGRKARSKSAARCIVSVCASRGRGLLVDRIRGGEYGEGKFDKRVLPTCFVSSLSFKAKRYHSERDGRGQPIGCRRPWILVCG